jgi:hypothetical protein
MAALMLHDTNEVAVPVCEQLRYAIRKCIETPDPSNKICHPEDRDESRTRDKENPKARHHYFIEPG